MNGLSENELEEFDDFVEEYTSKLNAIMEGKISDKEFNEFEREFGKRNGQPEPEVPRNPNANVDNKSNANTAKKPKDTLDYSKWNALDSEDDDDPKDSSTQDSKKTDKPPIPASERRKAALAAHLSQIRDRVRAHVQAVRDRAGSLFKQGKYAEALAEYQRAVDVSERPPEDVAIPPDMKSKNRLTDINAPTKSETDKGAVKGASGAPSMQTESLAAFSSAISSIYTPTTYAIPVDPLLYTNISLCHSRLIDHSSAAAAASRAIELDAHCVKAWWRRAESRKSSNDMEAALSDAKEVVRLVEEEARKAEVGAARAESGVSTSSGPAATPTVPLDTARKLVRTLEHAVADAVAAAEGGPVLAPHEAKNLETLLDLFCKRISPTSSTTSASESARTTASTALAATLSSHAACALFHARDGFLRILSPSVFSPSTLQYVLPVILAASSTPATKRALTRYAGVLVSVLARAKEDPNTGRDLRTASYAAQLVAQCSTEEAFIDALLPPRAATKGVLDGCADPSDTDAFLSGLLALARQPLPTQTSLSRSMRPLACDVPCAVMRGMTSLGTRWVARTPARGGAVVDAAAEVVKNAENVATGESERIERGREAALCLAAVTAHDGAKRARIETETWCRAVAAVSTVLWREMEAGGEVWWTGPAVDACLVTLANAATAATGPVVTPGTVTATRLIGVLATVAHAALPDTLADPCPLEEQLGRVLAVLARMARVGGEVLEAVFRDEDAWRVLGPRIAKVVELRGGHVPETYGADLADAAIADAALRVVAAYLLPPPGENAAGRVRGWEVLGGLDALVQCAEGEVRRVKTRVVVGNSGGVGEAESRVVGHIAWCLGACAKDSAYASKLYHLGAVEPTLSLLRATKDPAAQKNLAIAVGRLCQEVKARDRVRELKGFELLNSLGASLFKK
ncbi:hypothetical protein M427DRAFT_142250 [Gonapodya prolifera JEL478]|uniref:TPR-like protein n=1 Tax=Gonapodya prolifera (strain JEL478) TaxID=1344416 RepID=A0A139AYZ6_GONPJ|nr:hypothetical protein M427DRAFT_142250 [Gonapodya prolifera JEL478]|eukprot:KXS21937.1 hypothetical protein M427DRAFT_142250 [Gonapodya prolifera JEL478]